MTVNINKGTKLNMKRIISIIAFLMVVMSMTAQSCYNENRGDGLKFMQNKQYDKAIRCFVVAKECPDKPKNNDLDALINKCKKQKTAQKKTVKEPVRPTPPPVIPFSVNDNRNDFSVKFSASGGTKNFNVKGTSKYTVTDDNEWCKVSSQTNTSFSLMVGANTKPRERMVTLSVNNDRETIHVTANQEAYIPKWAPTGSTRKVSSPAAEMPTMRSNLSKNPICRLGGISSNRKGVAVRGNNEVFMTEEVPEGLKTILQNIQKGRQHIDAMALTGSDYYCVVWNENKWDGRVSAGMKDKLNGYIANGERIIDISICDDGNFVILSDKHVYASRKSDMDFIIEAEDNYGPSKSFCVTTYGICVVCEYGIVYRNIPDNLASALGSTHMRPDRVVYTDAGTYIISTERGECEYNIR